jgi:hypothetical protein
LFADKNNEVLRSAFLDAQNTRICTCGSDGNAVIWTADASQTKLSYNKALILPHGDSQIYACETMACVPTEHVMTASENQLHLWALADGGRDVPIKSLNFEINTTSASSGEAYLCCL